MKPGTCRQLRNKKRNPKKEETRNWLDLPYDVMIHIFLKLGVIELLFAAQSVCSSWRILAKDPQLYRNIDMRNSGDRFHISQYKSAIKMALEAIDRSCGQLVEFSISHFGEDCVLQHIGSSCTSLKCLRLSHCYRFADDVLIELLKKLSALEDFVSQNSSFATVVIEVLGRFCPHLKYLEFSHQGAFARTPHRPLDSNGEAYAIADNLPQLRRLQLLGSSMDNRGLNAILDKCIHLEYLDLQQCFDIHLNEDLQNKCKRIMKFRPPTDSTYDREFDTGTAMEYLGYVANHTGFSGEYYYDHSAVDDSEDDVPLI